MTPKAYVYADPNDSNELPGARMSYFYMHGEAEARTGYDCCNGNLEALRMCMKSGAFIAMLEFSDGKEELCIVRVRFAPEGHMSGFVALLSDLDAIKFAFINSEYYPSMYEHEKEFLREKHPEVRDAIREIVKNFKSKKVKSKNRILTEKEVTEKFTQHLTVGNLKKSIERYKIPDEAKVVVQRIEDVYYEKHGWGVMLKEGEHYHNKISFNEKMKEEIVRRERGEEPEYEKIKDPNKYICEDEEVLKELKDQYHPAWCVVGYEDKDFLFLDLHY